MSWTPGTPVRLTTKRFVIRSMIPADVTPRFLRWQSDPQTREGQNTHRKNTKMQEAKQIVAKADNRRIFYLLIGATFAETPIGLYTVKADLDNLVAETMVVIGEKSYWGKGVVLESRAALIDFLFDQHGMHKIVGRPHARNLASIFNYKAQGFTCEGVLREQFKSVADGSRLDQLEFGLLRDEWHASQRKITQ